MSNDYATEVEAIKTVLTTLDSLSPEARVRVVRYAMTTLGIQVDSILSLAPRGEGQQGLLNKTEDRTEQSPVHIKDLTEKKKPRSANEMAAVVAFFLANSVPSDQRKTQISTKDLETYFKIAGFPLPGQLKMTLPNAAGAGYFDAVGGGAYKLNAVGHNLVVHSMPRGDANRPKQNKMRSIAKKRKAKK
jgi:hypothetical protein